MVRGVIPKVGVAGLFGPVSDTSQLRMFLCSQAPQTVAGVTLGAGDAWFNFTAPSAPAVGIRGALPLGTANYTVPSSNMSFVAPGGSDAGAGTQADPFATVQHAIAVASNNGTVVVRAGIYHESFSTATNSTIVTVQNYPGEVVWFDGSSIVTGWAQSGATWTHTGIATQFTRNSGKGWSPLFSSTMTTDLYADLSDQVFLDGVPLTQIADNSTTPGVGQFSVNYTTNVITIGSNPTGKEVRVSDLRNLCVATKPVSWKGVGVRRYSPDYTGAIAAPFYYQVQSATFENLIIESSGMCGIQINQPNGQILNCTIQNLCLSGILSNAGDNLRIDSCLVQGVNIGKFVAQPQTAGIKITRCINLLITNTLVQNNNAANGIWTDVSVVTPIITSNAIIGDHNAGITYEESDGGLISGVQHRAVIAGNLIDGAKFSTLIFAAGNLDYYNNTHLNASTIYLWVRQDRTGNTSDNYVPQAECPWFISNVTLANNIFGPSATNLAIRYDDEFTTIPNLTASQLGGKCLNNLFTNAAGAALIQWGNSSHGYVQYSSLATAQSAEPANIQNNQQGATPNDASALPLPANVAAALGLAAGTKKIGAFIAA